MLCFTVVGFSLTSHILCDCVMVCECSNFKKLCMYVLVGCPSILLV